MKSTSESLSHPETSNGRATGGNCVVVRRGEGELIAQTVTRISNELHHIRAITERWSDGAWTSVGRCD